MVATRNQQNVIARSFGSVPNGSMPSYFGANELGQYNKNCVMNDLQRMWDKKKTLTNIINS